jgi:hypothetical protein
MLSRPQSRFAALIATAVNNALPLFTGGKL